MQIVPYPHPALAYRSVELKQIDATLRKTVREMFELMYQAEGIGLAANQVGLPFRLFVVNLAARADEPDEEFVFINPVIVKRRGKELGDEGCLSLPGLYGNVNRSSGISIEAFDLSGSGFRIDVDELAARVVQHESDHLEGILFTDRMRDEGTSERLDAKLPKFVAAWEQAQKDGIVPSDEEIRRDLQAIADTGRVPEEFLSRPPFSIPVPDVKG